MEDLLLTLSNAVEALILTQPELTGSQCITALKTLHDSEVFLTRVVLPLVEKKALEEGGDFDKDSVTDLVIKKIIVEKRNWENRLMESMGQEIKGILAALLKSSLYDKDLAPEDSAYLDAMLDALRNRGNP